MICHGQPSGRRTWITTQDSGSGRPDAAARATPFQTPEPGIWDALVAALDWLDQGIALVDSEGRVLFANLRARELLSGQPGFTISGGALQARPAALAAALRHMIVRCTSAGAEDAEASPLMSCRLGNPPLSFLVAGASPGASVQGGSGVAILFITDPTRTWLPATKQLRDQFGLTAAEAAMAVDLISGDGLKASARRLGVSVETARTHLRHIFDKTDVSRQAELVRLLLSTRHAVRQREAHAQPAAAKTGPCRLAASDGFNGSPRS